MRQSITPDARARQACRSTAPHRADDDRPPEDDTLHDHRTASDDRPLHDDGPLQRASVTAHGALVIALPGAGCSPAIFDAVHCGGLPWHAVDWFAGRGAFDPDAVADRIGRALAARPAPTVLAGHSLGAFVALRVAMRHPHTVAALVLSNTGARTAGHGDPGLPDRVRLGWDAAARDAFLRSCFDAEPPALLLDAMRTYLAALDRERFLEAVLGLRRMDVLADLPRVRCPTLVAHGERDSRRTPAAARELADGIPGARLAWLPGGHTPMVDCPHAYRAAVGDFLAGLGPTIIPTTSQETP